MSLLKSDLWLSSGEQSDHKPPPLTLTPHQDCGFKYHYNTKPRSETYIGIAQP